MKGKIFLFGKFALLLFLTTCSTNILEENNQVFIEDLIENFKPLIDSKHDRYIIRESPDVSDFYEFDNRVINFRNKNSICSVHFIEMENKKVGISPIHFSVEYSGYIYEIREILFPNCDDIIEGASAFGCCPRVTLIYVCDDCNNDRNNWWELNKESWFEKFEFQGPGFMIDVHTF